MSDTDRVLDLITSMKESLEREMAHLRGEMVQGFAEIRMRFDAQAARLDRHAALWQTGSRWSSRMDAWAEKIDGNADSTQKELSELKQRVRELERKLDQQNGGLSSL